MNKLGNKEIWLVSGIRIPFAKAGKELRNVGALDMSSLVLEEMNNKLKVKPDYLLWGTVVPNLEYSNIAREAMMHTSIPQETIAFSSTLACATSAVAAIQAASMITENEIAIIGGVESMSNVQLGLTQETSNWLRDFSATKGFFKKISKLGGFFKFKIYIPKRKNRATGKSMGEHAEITAQRLNVSREEQDNLALKSHQNYFRAKEKGFYTDLILPAFNLSSDPIPRKSTSIEKLKTLSPVFDTKSGKGSLTAGNSTLFTDGAAAAFVAGKNAVKNIKSEYKAKLIDWEMAGVTIEKEGMLMSPSFAIPRLLRRHNLKYDEIDLWEIHEAFASQVLSTIKNLENTEHLKKAGSEFDFGKFPMDKLNPNGGSIAIGHPFGATGARIISQAVKDLTLKGPGKKGVISVCADGGLGAVLLIES